MPTTIGTAAGPKNVVGVTLGTPAGNKQVTEIWLGTPGGAKLVFSAFGVTISGYVEPLFDYPEKSEPVFVGWAFYLQSAVTGGAAPYAYQWSVVSSTITHTANTNSKLSTFGAGAPANAYGSITFRCVVTEAGGLIATSQDLALTTELA